jgi:hypothetical protein
MTPAGRFAARLHADGGSSTLDAHQETASQEIVAMRMSASVSLPLVLVALTLAQAQEKRAPVAADVRDFGAVGDGQADDTAALEKAILSGRGVVRIPKGRFRITRTITIDLDKTGYIAFEGHGVGQVVMAGAGPALRFVGTHTKGSADPDSFESNVWQNQRMPAVDGVEFIGAHAEADAIQADGTMQLTVTRTRISQCRHGIHLVNRNRNLLVSECHIYHNRGIGIFYDNLSLHQSNIVGCHISYCGGGGIVSRGGDVRNIHIGACDLESNHSPDGQPTANILIDCRGSANGTAEVAITGCTIQHNSKSPDSANIRILGRGDRGGDGQAQWGHTTITGNVFSDVKTNVHLSGARGVTLTGNTFWMGYEHNLLVEDCQQIVIGPNALERNPAYAYGNSTSTQNATIFRNCSDCTISGLHIQGTHTTAAGLQLIDCNRFNITGCTILDCDNTGLLARNLTNSRISGCLIRDDREGKKTPSIKLDGGSGNQVVDNLTNDPASAKLLNR